MKLAPGVHTEAHMMKIGPEFCEIVPPPKVASEDAEAKRLGLARGMRIARNYNRQYRCANCDRFQPRGAVMVWVADGVKIGDPRWAIEENERCHAFNGSGSGWCLKCAQRLSGARPWWRFW
ncbi:MAG TPA: hypothetical protein VN903_11350 [Polyangia bacterium]|nr:hypothetical protein [Polyangia bacterium]